MDSVWISLDKVHKDKLEQFCREFNWEFDIQEALLSTLFTEVTKEQERYYTSPREKYDFSACNQSENVIPFPKGE